MLSLRRLAYVLSLALIIMSPPMSGTALSHDLSDKIDEIVKLDFSGYRILTKFVDNCADQPNLDNGELCFSRRVISKFEYDEGCIKRVLYQSGRGDYLRTGVWRTYNQDGQTLRESLYNDEALLFMREFRPPSRSTIREVSIDKPDYEIYNCRAYR